MNKPLTSLPTVYPTEIAHKGEDVYRKVGKQVEKKHLGDFMAIEVESGTYFLGETQIEALEKAKRRFPTKVFYLTKVGFPAAITFSGYQRPVSYGNIL